MTSAPTAAEPPSGIRYIYEREAGRVVTIPEPDLSELNLDLLIDRKHFAEINQEYEEKYFPVD